ncbi:hypothetical protein [Methylobacterium nodulans]|uniref:Uncharacterized protein n=1 Tax=Methylobacterium nodulans (strain LMG 21967 / CNCM I-2342 / ORS 2060) TaxID=460265 RepID=B8IH27_METNO|nr:hypothetical protein [Methylobacterium nodulans]ACL59719.1 hypothetical protein Mnod_4858 [Methylobacterium nodulans ORS 2060]
MRKLSLFVAAAMLATTAFWATMLTNPPKSEAAAVPAASELDLATADHCISFSMCQ